MIKNTQSEGLGVLKGGWASYNNNLSVRAEVYLDLSWLDSWLSEVKCMNIGKVGQPFFYPDTLIEMLAMLKAKGFSFRELNGLLRSLSKRLGGFPVISFSQIRRRINSLELTFPKVNSDSVIAVDGTGLKVSNRGEWIRHKWKVRRGWVKVVLAGTTKGDIVDLEVGDETFDEVRVARGMIKRIDCSEVLLDGLHDTYETYNVCEAKGVKLRTPARKGSNPKGLNPRSRAVREQLFLGRDEWTKKTGYGKRWVGSEGIFSAVKTLFGETLTGHKTKFLKHEAKLKFWAYQNLRDAIKI